MNLIFQAGTEKEPGAARREARKRNIEHGYNVRITHSVTRVENRHDHMVPLL